MDISALYKCFTECGKVTTDSRNCPEGSMFIALKGETFNGNAYALQALEKGCQYAVVDEKEYAADGHPRILLVDDCLKALQELANYHRHKMGTRIIGITGSLLWHLSYLNRFVVICTSYCLQSKKTY